MARYSQIPIARGNQEPISGAHPNKQNKPRRLQRVMRRDPSDRATLGQWRIEIGLHFTCHHCELRTQGLGFLKRLWCVAMSCTRACCLILSHIGDPSAAGVTRSNAASCQPLTERGGHTTGPTSGTRVVATTVVRTDTARRWGGPVGC